MKRLATQLAFILLVINGEAFYRKIEHKNIKKITPKTMEELKTALCNKTGGKCNDEPAEIIIKGVFDFTNSEGFKTEAGCHHLSDPPECKERGQMKLNVNDQCKGLEPAEVTYSAAGRNGLEVGSNKIIRGSNGGGLMGKGLVLSNVKNVEIKNLRITDINPRVIWGGDAIDIRNSKNILIDNCYFKNIGRQMIVTHFGSNTGILVKNSVFDGSTPYSPYCNGRHYWLWLFLGEGDTITMRNNVIAHTSGRGPHLVAQPNSKSLLHLLQNIFYDIQDPGLLIEHEDTDSSILAEGNVFYKVNRVVHSCKGHIFFPKTKEEAKQCKEALGRKCLVNIAVKSGETDPKNDPVVLEDFKLVKDSMIHPVKMKDAVNKHSFIPDEVKHLLHETK